MTNILIYSKMAISKKTTSIYFFALFCAIKIGCFAYLIASIHPLKNFVYQTLLSVIVLLPIVFFLAGRPWWSTLFYLGQTVYLFVNLAYCSYFHHYLHFFVGVGLFAESLPVAGTVLLLVKPSWIFLLIDLIPFVFFVKYSKKISLNTFLVSLLAVVLVLIVIEICLYRIHKSIIQQFSSNSKIEKAIYGGEESLVSFHGTLLNNCLDILSTNEKSDVASIIPKMKFVARQSPFADLPNIVVIQVESLDAAVVNSIHKGKFVTPFFNDLTKNSLYYPYTLSTHAGGGSSDCDFSILTGCPSLMAKCSMKLRTFPFGNSLPMWLKELGYKSIAFHGNVGSYYNRDIVFSKVGFDKFYDLNGMKLKNKGWGASDGDILSFVLSQEDLTEGPFFHFIITMSSHEPYANVLNYCNNDRYSDIKDPTTRNYLTSMHYVDSVLGDYCKTLLLRYPNTIVLITGDHSAWGVGAPLVSTKIEYNSQQLEFVPTFIFGCGIKASRRILVASPIDFAPTILSLTGYPTSVMLDGLDLLGLMQNVEIHQWGMAFPRGLLSKQ